MNILAFDLETGPVDVETWNRTDQIGITCGALYGELSTGEIVRQVYWAGMLGATDDVVSPEDVIEVFESGYVPPREMEPLEVEAMLNGIETTLSTCKELSAGRVFLFTHNGSTFDFPAIAAMVPGHKKRVVELMESSIDPWFQIVRTFGWPISLDNIARPMLGEGKLEGMDGLKASLIWPVEAAKVLTYVMRDAQITHDVAKAVMAERQVRWIKKDGDVGAKPFTQWKTVKGASKLPEPNRSWMRSYSGEFDLDNMLAWTK